MGRRRLAVVSFGLGVCAVPVALICIQCLVPLFSPAAAAQAPQISESEDEEPLVIQPRAVEADQQTFYLNLVRQKIKLLTPEQMARETKLLQKELVDLQANQKLRVAEHELEQIIEQHPGSDAARRAAAMLDQGRKIQSGKELHPELVPIPAETGF